MNLRTATPAEIDAAAYPLMEKAFAASMIYSQARDAYVKAQHAPAGSLAARRVDERERWMDEARREADAAKLLVAPYEAEFNRRGGWTRYPHTITNGQGHFHRSFSCSTCHPTTQYGLQAEYSGLTEHQLVDKVGSEACTVCFPWAPTTDAWGRTQQAAQNAKVAEKLTKWEKGREVRVKKLTNAEKRLAKHIASGDHARYCSAGRCYDGGDVQYARNEMSRWDAKKP